MRVFWAVVCALILFPAAAVWAQGSETQETLRSAPPAVQRAVAAEEHQGATLRGFVKEVAAGVTVYEAEMTVGGRTRDILFDVEGKIVSLEEQKTLSEIPSPARAAIQKAVGTGKLMLVEKVTKGKLTFYEGHIASEGQTTEVKVDASGQPVE
jgi:uncharacterized membrane protein YkoI